MEAGRQEYCWFRSWSFRELNELATEQHTQSAHRRLHEDDLLVLVVSIQTTCTLGTRRLKPHAGGRRSCYIADFQSWIFRKWSRYRLVSSLLPQRGNHFKAWRVARHSSRANRNNNVTYTHRPVDSKTGKPSTAAVESGAVLTTEQDIDFENLFKKQVDRRIDVIWRVGVMRH